MTKISKRIKGALQLIVVDKVYNLEEAIGLIVDKYASKSKAKFDETFEISIKTGINTQKNETVKGSLILPHGNGKVKRVGVFAEGEDIKIATDLGATIMTVESVKAGEYDFDTCIATPDMMSKLGAVAKILGPRGLMPNPKLGTVTKDMELES
jgi:large subunit ribosomal protein L1